MDITDWIPKGVESLKAHKVYLDNLGRSIEPDEFLRGYAQEMGERLARPWP